VVWCYLWKELFTYLQFVAVMIPGVPLSQLRSKLAQQGSKGLVGVNQRSLIDKLLARYKGEHTVFRELVQNADDAASSCVVIEIQYDQNSGFGVVRISLTKFLLNLEKNDVIQLINDCI